MVNMNIECSKYYGDSITSAPVIEADEELDFIHVHIAPCLLLNKSIYAVKRVVEGSPNEELEAEKDYFLFDYTWLDLNIKSLLEKEKVNIKDKLNVFYICLIDKYTNDCNHLYFSFYYHSSDVEKPYVYMKNDEERGE